MRLFLYDVISAVLGVTLPDDCVPLSKVGLRLLPNCKFGIFVGGFLPREKELLKSLQASIVSLLLRIRSDLELPPMCYLP